MDSGNTRLFESVFFSVHWVWHASRFDGIALCVCVHAQSTFGFSPLINIWVIIVSNNSKSVHGNMLSSLLIIHLSRLIGFLVNFVTQCSASSIRL